MSKLEILNEIMVRTTVTEVWGTSVDPNLICGSDLNIQPLNYQIILTKHCKRCYSLNLFWVPQTARNVEEIQSPLEALTDGNSDINNQSQLSQGLTWCMCWRCPRGKHTGVSSWRRDRLCCRGGSPDCRHTATPGTRSLHTRDTRSNLVNVMNIHTWNYYKRVIFYCIVLLYFGFITKNINE